MHTNLRLTLACLTAALMAFGAVPALATGESDELAGITDSSQLSSTPVASGTILDSTGAPVGAGELVVLYGWPSNAILDSLQVEESVKIVPVAKAYTTSSGQFDLRIGDPTLLDPLKAADNQVDLMVTSDTEASSYTHNFDRLMLNGTSGVVFVERSPQGGGHTIDPVPTPTPLGGGTTFTTQQEATVETVPETTDTLEIELNPIESGAASEESDAGAKASVSGEYGDKQCRSYLKAIYAPQLVTVGQSFVATTGVWSDFQYSSGANTSLGIGVSATGSYGSFSRSGTTSVNASGSIDFPTQGRYTYKRFQTKFRYSKFLYQCRLNSSGVITKSQYQVRPTGWAGGTYQASQQVPSATYCVNQLAGSKFTKNTSQAITWTNGASTSGIIGLSLTAQTGYNSSARAYFNFISARRLCGTHGYPGGSPAMLVVK